jgi:pyruvate dehydrogenase (quinone)
LANRLKAPIVHAFRGKEHIEWENQFDVGMTGLIGFSSGYCAMLDCDVLLMLGTDFPYRQFHLRGARVQIGRVDMRPANVGRRASGRKSEQLRTKCRNSGKAISAVGG